MKTESFISGFDEISGTGFSKGRIYCLKGKTGTGKSIFGIQFLFYGALERGENGIYVCQKDFRRKIEENYLVFGWDLRKIENKGKIHIIDSYMVGKNSEYLEEDKPDLLLEILRICKQNKIKRIVFDCDFSQEIILKIKNLSFEKEICSLFIFGNGECDESLFDGVVKFSKKNEEREIEIKKLVGAKHSLRKHKMKITNSGISVSEN